MERAKLNPEHSGAIIAVAMTERKPHPERSGVWGKCKTRTPTAVAVTEKAFTRKAHGKDVYTSIPREEMEW